MALLFPPVPGMSWPGGGFVVTSGGVAQLVIPPTVVELLESGDNLAELLAPGANVTTLVSIGANQVEITD